VANPLENSVAESGEIPFDTRRPVLALGPLRVLLPKSRSRIAFKRHRPRNLCDGVRYGLLHFIFHVLYEGGFDGLVRGPQNIYLDWSGG